MSLTTARQSGLQDLLTGILTRFAASIEFWTITCISRQDFGDPEHFIGDQWSALRDEVQELRELLGDSGPGCSTSPMVQEQMQKLMQNCTGLRQIFDRFIRYDDLHLDDLERNVVQYAALWTDVKLRVMLLGTIIPLPAPLPGLSSDRDLYFVGILDRLYDRFESARTRR